MVVLPPRANLRITMPLPPIDLLAKRVYSRLPRGWTAGMDAALRLRHGPNRQPARLDVMTAVSGPNLDVVQVMLRSLSDSHPRDDIHLWFPHLPTAQPVLDALAAYCEGLGNLTLHLLPVADKDPFVHLSRIGGRPYGARFLWLAAHHHLPASLSRVIFLDPLDIIVQGDLVPFLRHPFLGRYIVACREVPSAPPLIAGPASRAQARGASARTIWRISRGVMNSGAIVLNLDRLRRDGIGMQDYVAVGEWAQAQGLNFGDQGLFSLTHGSHYVQAHDRWNFRFFTLPRGSGHETAAVIHFAGNIPKPFHLRLTAAQEEGIAAMMRQRNLSVMPITRSQIISPAFFPFYRAWWAVCARTPVHDRIAPLADEVTERLLAEMTALAQE